MKLATAQDRAKDNMYMNYSRRGDLGISAVVLLVIIAIVVIIGFKSCTIVEPGHTGVQVTMGKVDDTPVSEGSSFINPFSHLVDFDTRQQSHTEDDVQVPSRDQLVSQLDVTVQYTLNRALCPKMLKEVGDANRVKEILLVPKLRSALREATKTVERAEEYSTNETQTKLQNFIQSELSTLAPSGVLVNEILLRDIKLPAVISTAVQKKKQAEQEVLEQEALFQKFTVQQKQKVAQAEAEKTSAEQTALKTKIEADAEAYKIRLINEAASANPVYVQLEALKALEKISANPAHKIFFIDNNGKYPVPLMHMNDAVEAVATPPTPKK